MIRNRFLAAAALAALLAACGDKSAPQEGGLQGEVLEGTISDEMIPLDTVKSQAPLAGDASDAASGDTPAGNGRTSNEAAETDAAQPTPVPAETPVTTTDGQTG